MTDYPGKAAGTPPPEYDTPQEIVELVQQLVRIPSVTGTEQEVADFAAGWLREAGLAVEVYEEEPGRPNVIATIGPEGGPLYAFNGHLDTVPVPKDEPWAHPPFEAEIVDGRMYGRGTFDMKGGVGASMWAAARLAERADELQGRLQVHLVCEEEKGGSRGSGAVARAIEAGRLPRPDGIIAGELSWFHVRVAERGIFQFRIRFRGRSAHTARARADGLNAIAAAGRGVLALEQHIDEYHPAVGYPVLSVNRIEAGTSNNQVPASCTIFVDRRTVPGETKESVLDEVRTALDALEDTLPDGRRIPVEYELLTEDEDLAPVVPANMTDENEPLVQAVWQGTEDVLGYRTPLYTDWGGATDARWFRQLGIPMVILGPTGAGAHAADEYVDVAALGALAEIYRRTVGGLLGLDFD